MYKGRIVLTLCFAFVVLTAMRGYGQDTTGFQGFKTPKLPYKQNVLKSNVIPIFDGQIFYCSELRLTYEHLITHNQSISAGVSYNFPNIFLLMATAHLGQGSVFHTLSMRGARGILSYRIYPLKDTNAPEGFFVGPYVSYNFVKIAEKNGNSSYEVINYFNASGIAGYQYLVDGFSIEVFGGLGYRDNFISNYDSRLNKSYTSSLPIVLNLGKFKYVKLVAQINLGYAF